MSVQIDVTVLRESEKAWLVLVDEQEIWLPKSQIIDSESDDLEVGDSGTLTITDFIAAEKGLD